MFHPLDPNERLPRELILEGRRQRWYERRRLLTAFGFGYLPALVLVVIFLTTVDLDPVLAFVLAGVALVGLVLVALSCAR